MALDIFTFKDNELYGSEIPATKEDLLQLKALGIDVIISFTDEILPIKRSINEFKDFKHLEIFITDYATPSRAQVEEFLMVLEKLRAAKKKILVHCYAGCGRTGLMLALAEKFVYGVSDGNKAIKNVREVRPCAVETQEQRDFVINYQRDNL